MLAIWKGGKMAARKIKVLVDGAEVRCSPGTTVDELVDFSTGDWVAVTTSKEGKVSFFDGSDTVKTGLEIQRINNS